MKNKIQEILNEEINVQYNDPNPHNSIRKPMEFVLYLEIQQDQLFMNHFMNVQEKYAKIINVFYLEKMMIIGLLEPK